MTHAEVFTMLQSVGVPVAYYQFPNDSGQELPFICFYYPDNDDFLADDTNYTKINALNVELYTDEKDFDLEETLEGVLTDHGLVFSWDETYIDSERMHMTTYYTEVIINASSDS